MSIEDEEYWKKFQASDFEDHIDTKEISIVLFVKEFCPHCFTVYSALNKISNDNTVPLYVVDSRNNSRLLDKYSVSMVPTIIVFREGRIDNVVEGVGTEDNYKSLLSED